METLSHLSQSAMITTATFLGMRHGLDLDHIATIDAMTRAGGQGTSTSRFVGAWFSTGHGAVVMLVALLLSFTSKAIAPLWLEKVGSYISIFFLLLFAVMNAYTLFRPKQERRPISFKSSLLTPFLQKEAGPLFTMLVGALFALSFDTVSQVCLFSLAAQSEGQVFFALVLALFFTLGMIAADGVNGLVVSIVLKKAKMHSEKIFNTLSILITVLSFIVALIAIMQLLYE